MTRAIPNIESPLKRINTIIAKKVMPIADPSTINLELDRYEAPGVVKKLKSIEALHMLDRDVIGLRMCDLTAFGDTI